MASLSAQLPKMLTSTKQQQPGSPDVKPPVQPTTSNPITSGHLPISGRANGARRPIGVAAIRGKGIAHAITPGNTPSSLERITRRITNTLTVGEVSSNKIAPSYERRFNAGLGEINRRLTDVAEDRFVASSTTAPHPQIVPAPKSTHGEKGSGSGSGSG